MSLDIFAGEVLQAETKHSLFVFKIASFFLDVKKCKNLEAIKLISFFNRAFVQNTLSISLLYYMVSCENINNQFLVLSPISPKKLSQMLLVRQKKLFI
jgi:hypothetical protein